MSILLNILLLYKISMIFTSNFDCKQFNNCYECLNNPQCFIINNYCDNYENEPLKNENQNQGQGQGDAKISPQQAQQMLNAIQAREKETQDKVNKEKAAVLKSRQKDKNW